MARGGVYIYRTRKPASLIGLLGLRYRILVPCTVALAVTLCSFGVPWLLAFPLLLATGRHFAYVGETTSFYHRHRQHTGNGGTTDRFITDAAPWSDLDPVCVARLPLPRWKWLLRSVETLMILALAPVYNDRKNHHNPRRIARPTALRQRLTRDGRWLNVSFNFSVAHAFFILTFIVFVMVTVRLA